eukprot:m51a1_g11512 hypothetical protein (509) ;mRNA; f:9096-12999
MDEMLRIAVQGSELSVPASTSLTQLRQDRALGLNDVFVDSEGRRLWSPGGVVTLDPTLPLRYWVQIFWALKIRAQKKSELQATPDGLLEFAGRVRLSLGSGGRALRVTPWGALAGGPGQQLRDGDLVALSRAEGDPLALTLSPVPPSPPPRPSPYALLAGHRGCGLAGVWVAVHDPAPLRPPQSPARVALETRGPREAFDVVVQRMPGPVGFTLVCRGTHYTSESIGDKTAADLGLRERDVVTLLSPYFREMALTLGQSGVGPSSRLAVEPTITIHVTVCKPRSSLSCVIAVRLPESSVTVSHLKRRLQEMPVVSLSFSEEQRARAAAVTPGAPERVFVFDVCKSRCNSSRLHLGGRVVVCLALRRPSDGAVVARVYSDPLQLVSRGNKAESSTDTPIQSSPVDVQMIPDAPTPLSLVPSSADEQHEARKAQQPAEQPQEPQKPQEQQQQQCEGGQGQKEQGQQQAGQRSVQDMLEELQQLEQATLGRLVLIDTLLRLSGVTPPPIQH